MLTNGLLFTNSTFLCPQDGCCGNLSGNQSYDLKAILLFTNTHTLYLATISLKHSDKCNRKKKLYALTSKKSYLRGVMLLTSSTVPSCYGNWGIHILDLCILKNIYREYDYAFKSDDSKNIDN